MHVIVDTNVPVVANGNAEQASPACVAGCVQAIREIYQQHVLVLDDGWRVLREYIANLRSTGQPGVGDEFLQWVLVNRTNRVRCEQVPLTRQPHAEDDNDFCEFPDDEALAHFDRSDRKFVALALAHHAHPPVYNAVDSDWWLFHNALAAHGVGIVFVCPDALP